MDQEETKEVEYRGARSVVPVWPNYIAADMSGAVFAYEQKPEWTHGVVYMAPEGSQVALVGDPSSDAAPPLVRI